MIRLRDQNSKETLTPANPKYTVQCREAKADSTSDERAADLDSMDFCIEASQKKIERLCTRTASIPATSDTPA